MKKTARMFMVFLSVLLLSSVIMVKPDLADAQPGPEIDYLFPNAAYDPQFNRYLVVYQRVVTGELSTEYYVDGQFVRLDGALIGDPFPISELGNTRHGSSIARGSDGRFLAVWDADDEVATVKIIGQFVNPDGTLDGSNFVVSDAVSFKMRPQIASSQDSQRFLVIWDDDRNWETSSNDVYGQLVGEDGYLKETVSSVNFAVTNANNSQYSPSLAYDTNNSRFLVAWGDTRVNGMTADVYGQLINPDWGGDPARGSHFLTASDVNFPICTEPMESQYFPRLAFDAVMGRFLVVWQDYRSLDHNDIYGQLVNGFDGGVNYYGGNIAEGLLIVAAPNDLYEPHVVRDDCNEGFLVVWGDNRSEATYDIYGLLLDGNAAPKESDFLISDTEYDVGAMSVTVNGNCGALVAFQDPQPTGYVIGLAITGGLPDIAVTPSPVDFGDVMAGDSSTQEITIQNNGDANLTVTSWEVLGTDAGMFGVVSGGSGPCGETPVVLTPGSSCTLNGTFTPTSSGNKTATLRIHSNDPETPSADASLNGSGLAPEISISPGSLDFGDVNIGTSANHEVTVTNEGTEDLLLTSVALSGNDAAMFSVASGGSNPCGEFPATITAGNICTLLVTFSPRSEDAKTATLTIASNDLDEPTIDIPLSGTGLSTKVTLGYPNGGEPLKTGENVLIEWGAPASAVKFKLFYSVDNGATWVKITPDFVFEKSYPWTVPSLTANKKTCLVKVVGYKANGVPVGSDQSDATFTIEVVKLISPDGDNILYSGTTEIVTWRVNATKSEVASVKLYYTKNNGTTWLPMATLKPVTTPSPITNFVWPPVEYAWTVPDVPGPKTKCKVKIVLKSKAGVTLGSDVSDAVFTITNDL